MLRFKILVSAVLLIAAAILARVEIFPSPRPCVTPGSGTVEIGSAPWHADLHVNSIDDPRLATVRVAISNSTEAAGFGVVDGIETIGERACVATPATRFVGAHGQRPHLAAADL